MLLTPQPSIETIFVTASAADALAARESLRNFHLLSEVGSIV